jgi:hypothetical protein
MEFDDEIEDTSDLGQCICILLSIRGFGAKEDLWNILEKSLSDNAFDDLKTLITNFWEERRGE